MPLTPRRSAASVPVSGTHVCHTLHAPAARRSKTTDYQAFTGLLRAGLHRHPVRLLAYQVLPTECHLVVGPTDGQRATALLRWVTSAHTIPGRGSEPPGQLHIIRLSGDLVATCCAVERLPLEAGLVRRAQDWPWGSLADRLRPFERLPLAPAGFLSSRSWVEFVNAPATRRPPEVEPSGLSRPDRAATLVHRLHEGR